MKKLLCLIVLLAAINILRADLLIEGIPADNLIAWYDANDIDVPTYVDQNNVITTWPNRITGGANDLVTQSGTVYYQSDSLFNSRPYLDTLSSTGKMRADGLVDMLDGKTFTIFTIVDTQYVGFTNGGGGSRFYGRGHTFTVGNPAIVVSPPDRINVPAVRMYKLDAEWDEQAQSYINGYVEMKLNNSSTNFATASTTSQGSVITFGNGYLEIPYGTNYGKYAEIIVYDRALTTVEENAVGYYLSQKYDISTEYTAPTIYTLDISSNLAFIDTVTPVQGSYQFLDGQVVELSAQVYSNCPDIYEFSSWSGGVAEPTLAETSILIDGDKAVVANYSLSSTQCTSITIATSPAGLGTTTPAAGVYYFSPGEIVDIEAETDYVNCPVVYGFMGWSGNGVTDPLSNSTTLSVTSSATITAVYEDARECGDICHPYPEFDSNSDCIVDLSDFASLASAWMDCTTPLCD
jgi:hypothetical protein